MSNTNLDVAPDGSETRHWLSQLADEDIAFLKRFLLASGSLKALAEAYGISYPTVRLRLDRLIAKVKILEDQRIDDAFERLARAKFAEGAIDSLTLKQLLQAHRKTLEKNHDSGRATSR